MYEQFSEFHNINCKWNACICVIGIQNFISIENRSIKTISTGLNDSDIAHIHCANSLLYTVKKKKRVPFTPVKRAQE